MIGRRVSNLVACSITLDWPAHAGCVQPKRNEVDGLFLPSMKIQLAVFAVNANDAKILEHVLSSAHYECAFFDSSDTLLAALDVECYDALIVDWSGENAGPAMLIRRLRHRAKNNPPLMCITGAEHPLSVADGLRLGADQCTVRPISPAVLVAQIEAMLRRARGTDVRSSREIHGDYTFHISRREVEFMSKCVSLTHKEFDIALLMFRNISHTVTRAHILRMIWGEANPAFSRTLDSHVAKLRAKLELRAGQHGYRLVAIYGHGYRLDRIGAARQAM